MTAGYVTDANDVDATAHWPDAVIEPLRAEQRSVSSLAPYEVHRTYHGVATLMHQMLTGGQAADPTLRLEQERAVRRLLGYC